MVYTMKYSVTLYSPDKSLTDEVWSIAPDGISVEALMAKAIIPDMIHEISAYTKDCAALIAFLGALFKLVKSEKNKHPSSTTISINCSENSTNVIQFIDANKGQINVVINDNRD